MNRAGSHTSAYFSAAALVLLGAVAAATITGQWLYLLLPFAVLLAAAILHQPKLLFFLLIASIPWSAEVMVTDSLGSDLPDEPLMLATAFALLLHFIFYRKSFLKSLQLHPLILLLLLQAIWITVTVATSTFPLISFKYLLAKSWYLLSFTAVPVVLLQSKKDVRTTVIVLLCSMLAFTLLALIRHGLQGFTFATINTSLAPFFRNHVNYSALLVCTIPLLFVCIQFTNKRVLKSLLIVLLMVLLAALYLSYARGAWLALVVGVLAFYLLYKKVLVQAYAFVLIILLAVALWLQKDDHYIRYAHDYNTTIFHTDFREHLKATYAFKDVSTAERFYRWVAGVRMVKEGSVTGFGPGTFYNNYKNYTITQFKTWVSGNKEKSTVHNYFLLLLIEQGVMGLLLFVLLTGYLFYTAQKIYHRTKDLFWKRAAACIAVILAMLCAVNFLSDLIETDKVGSIFYLCVGFLIVADVHTKRETSELATHV